MTARSFAYAPAVLLALCITPATGPGPDIDPAWLSFDTPAKTTRFQLIAGLTGLNGALNFNPVKLSAPFKDRKSTRLNSSHVSISYAVFCLKKKRPNVI